MTTVIAVENAVLGAAGTALSLDDHQKRLGATRHADIPAGSFPFAYTLDFTRTQSRDTRTQITHLGRPTLSRYIVGLACGLGGYLQQGGSGIGITIERRVDHRIAILLHALADASAGTGVGNGLAS